jgi:RNA polymerase sigma factor (TIGR02999 family)
MSDVTEILSRIDRGDTADSGDLLPLIYAELRALAATRLAQEASSVTLQPTALVHEAWMRLRSGDPGATWNSRGHFFGAAAEAMRRILIERARQKRTLKRGGRRNQVTLTEPESKAVTEQVDLLALDEALSKLQLRDPRKAELVKLRFFAGMTIAEAAGVLGVSVSTAENDWAYARCWLRLEMEGTG